MHSKWIVLFICCILTSCGGNWVSKTKSPASLDQDMERCQAQAKKQYPPKTYFKHMPSYESVATSYGRSGVTVRPMEEFNVQEVDSNAEDRDQAFKKCMVNNGWNQE